jgi:phage terminase small subunit
VRQRGFVCEYDGNGGNGTRAYMAAYGKTDPASCAVMASELLRVPKVRAAVDALRQARWKRLQMTGDEALSLIAGDARADLRALVDEKGELLPVHLWPDHVALSVRSIKPGPFGLQVTLNDSLAARKIIAEQSGAVKSIAGGLDALAEAINADKAKHERKPLPTGEPES